MNDQIETNAKGPHDTDHATFNGMVEVDGELMASYTLHFEL
jgi:hypothetical protein